MCEQVVIRGAVMAGGSGGGLAAGSRAAADRTIKHIVRFK